MNTHDDSNHLVASRDGPLLVLRLNRQARHNAMTARMAAEFNSALDGLSDARAVVVTGTGASFCSGADLDELRQSRAPEYMPGPYGDLGQGWHVALEHLAVLPCPTIAAIEGYCLGGGLVLGLACDFRFGSRGCRLGLPEIRYGMAPGFGATQRLPRVIGASRAKHLLFTGEPIDAPRAELWGLLHEVTEPGEALSRALEYARALCERAPRALATMKHLVDSGLDLPLPEAMRIEAEYLLTHSVAEESHDTRVGQP